VGMNGRSRAFRIRNGMCETIARPRVDLRLHQGVLAPPVRAGSVGTLEAEADDGARTRDTWLGKPVLYQLSYVREAWILAALPPSAFRGRRQLSADSAVSKRGVDARSQVAG
jgi:hypothetical protein